MRKILSLALSTHIHSWEADWEISTSALIQSLWPEEPTEEQKKKKKKEFILYLASFIILKQKRSKKNPKKVVFIDSQFTVNFSFPEKPHPLQSKQLDLGLDIARKTPSEK